MQDTATQNPITIVILLAIAVAFLWLHFTNGSGRLRLGLAALLVVASIVLLLPTFRPALPDWLNPLDTLPKIQLGLDLQGGTHLLLEVELDEAVKAALRRHGDDIKREMQNNKLGVPTITTTDNDALRIQLPNPDEREAFMDLMAKAAPDLTFTPADNGGGVVYTAAFKDPVLIQTRALAMDQALETIRNRIDQLGVRETTVEREGDNDILVQLPGIQDPEQAKELIGKTAVLEFKLIDDKHSLSDAETNGAPPGDELLDGQPQPGGAPRYLVESPVLMTGDVVVDAEVRPGAQGLGPYVLVTLNSTGARIFGEITAANVGRRLAIILDNTVYSDPVIKEPIPGGDVQITGNFTFDEAHQLAIVLRSGALPAPVKIIEERTVGPSLGRDSIRQGELSFVVGAVAVLGFMAIYYSGAGLLADFGLALNILLLLCVMAAMQATLTLPGIAGIVLTLGMSVDANVLVNERMREELRAGKSAREAVRTAYERAWSAIRDSNISTFVAGLILFQFGTGPVKGFAVTLCVGVLTGVFSCFVVTRAWYDWKIGMRKLTAVSV
ncbi:MAG TPA: protein translocase subunit SecD [Candidatus Binataceae bacterium]|nr:protein translocase subunit SecD [Candidatus Binataceae bacterium]